MFDRLDTGMYWDRAWRLVDGCTPVSPGCDHCWAASESRVRCQHPNLKVRQQYAEVTRDGQFTGEVYTLAQNLEKPLTVRKPTVWAVWNDLFHADVPDFFITRALAVMAACPQHRFLVLTKRADRMQDYFSSFAHGAVWANLLGQATYDLTHNQEAECRVVNGVIGVLGEGYNVGWPLCNLWLGVTAENQAQADARIPLLLQTPAAVRWVSVEPMLGPLEFSDVTHRSDCISLLGKPAMSGIDWVVCGGESGHGARPMHPAWARGLRDQCQAAGVPFFFKQWGNLGSPYFDMRTELPTYKFFDSKQHWVNKGSTWLQRGDVLVDMAGKVMRRGGDFDNAAYPVAILRPMTKKAAGRLLDGRVWDELPVQGLADRG